MDIVLLVKITARAWALPVLALMHDGAPGRQAVLLDRTGAGRTALGQSLTHLIALGLVERTPGHGHPLRPEYRLTDAGETAGAMASAVMRASPGQSGVPLLRRAWSLPVLAVSQRPRLFSEIKQALPGITDRALSQSLKGLQGQSWLDRHVEADVHPPRARYRAAGDGVRIGQAAMGLAA